jgi:hypothetical protein
MRKSFAREPLSKRLQTKSASFRRNLRQAKRSVQQVAALADKLDQAVHQVEETLKKVEITAKPLRRSRSEKLASLKTVVPSRPFPTNCQAQAAPRLRQNRIVYQAHRFALQNLFAPDLNVQPRLPLWLSLLFPGFSLFWTGADRRFDHSFVRSSARILSLLRWLVARPGIIFDIAHCRLFRAAYARWTGQERALVSMMTNKLTGPGETALGRCTRPE